MTVIETPSARTCRRCGRSEEWDDAAGKWVAAGDDITNLGTAHCVHDWDVDGYNDPLR